MLGSRAHAQMDAVALFVRGCTDQMRDRRPSLSAAEIDSQSHQGGNGVTFRTDAAAPENEDTLEPPWLPGRPRTKVDEFNEMKRRRASFRQWIADYEARRGERDEAAYEVWY